MTRGRTALQLLDDMQSAGQKALDFLGDHSIESPQHDEKTLFAVVRPLEILGEATKRIPDDVRALSTVIPWKAVAGMRDKLIHDYVVVNVEIVWRTIREDLPPLLLEVDRLRHVMNRDSS